MNQIPVNHEPYRLHIKDAYDIVRGYWGGRACPLEIWLYDRYILLPKGCIFQYSIAAAFITLN